MKLYFASPENTDFSALKIFGVEKFLYSYHFLKKLEKKKLKDYLKVPDVFIDSGAFSAKTLGIEINLDEYCDFIQENELIHYASLDVIGDGDKTLLNTKKMIEKGLKPIHTFHKSTPEEFLYKSLELDLDYIALGGMVGNKKNIYNWLDEVWKIIQKNKPELKVHGFGCTSLELMKRYPWYSVDSTSWNSARKFGTGFDFKGNTIEKKQILDTFNKVEYFDFFQENHLLLFQNVYSLLKMEKTIKSEDLSKNYNYLTAQKGLFE